MTDHVTTAADQPTTEPSVVERVAEVLDRAWSDHHAACVAWSEDTDPATLGDHPKLVTNLDLAQALADAGLLVLAPQPAADTEGTVVWARGFRQGDGTLFIDDQDGSFRDREDVTDFVRPGNPESPYDLIVSQHRTPWREEA